MTELFNQKENEIIVSKFFNQFALICFNQIDVSNFDPEFIRNFRKINFKASLNYIKNILSNIFIRHEFEFKNIKLIFPFIEPKYLKYIFKLHEADKNENLLILYNFLKIDHFYFIDEENKIGQKIDIFIYLEEIFFYFRSKDICLSEVLIHTLFSDKNVDIRIRNFLENVLLDKDRNFYLVPYYLIKYFSDFIFYGKSLKNNYFSDHIFDDYDNVPLLLIKAKKTYIQNLEFIEKFTLLEKENSFRIIFSSLFRRNSFLHENLTKKWMYDERIWRIVSLFI